MSERMTHKFTSVDQKAITFVFRRDLLSDVKFSRFLRRFAPGDKPLAVEFNFCWLAAHVVEAKGIAGFPLPISVTDQVFWLAFERTLALFESIDDFVDVCDAIPVDQLPTEDDPVKKPLEALTPDERAEIDEAKLLEANGDPVPEKN